MQLTLPSHPVWRMLLLPPVLALGSLPATAQSGSEAVVCVGSERRTLATNPIRRVYTEDMEIVYRIGADIGQRDQVERDLSSELGSHPEVWCAPPAAVSALLDAAADPNVQFRCPSEELLGRE